MPELLHRELLRILQKNVHHKMPGRRVQVHFVLPLHRQDNLQLPLKNPIGQPNRLQAEAQPRNRLLFVQTARLQLSAFETAPNGRLNKKNDFLLLPGRKVHFVRRSCSRSFDLPRVQAVGEQLQIQTGEAEPAVDAGKYKGLSSLWVGDR